MTDHRAAVGPAAIVFETVRSFAFRRSAADVFGVGIKPDLQKAQTFFQYGNDAAMKSNFDYAIDMYRQACKLVPDNMVYRQALRGVERTKFNGDPEEGRDAGRGQESADPDAGQVGPIEGEAHAGDGATARTRSSTIPGTSGRRGWRPRRPSRLGLLVLAQWFVESVQAVHEGRRFLQVRRRTSTRSTRAGTRRSPAGSRSRSSTPTTRTPAGRSMHSRRPATIKRAGLDDALDKRAAAAAAGEPAESLDGQARAAQARAAHARTAADQGDHGRPDGRSRLRRAGRHLSQARRPRQGREGPGQGPQGQSRRPGPDVDLRGHADQPAEDRPATASSSACSSIPRTPPPRPSSTS